MTLHDHRGVASWAETTCRAGALDEIAREVAHYIAPDSGITKEALVSKIIETIETRTNFVFIRYPQEPQAEFSMTASERPDEQSDKSLP